MNGESIEGKLTNMDGVLVCEHQALLGLAELLEQRRLKDLPRWP